MQVEIENPSTNITHKLQIHEASSHAALRAPRPPPPHSPSSTRHLPTTPRGGTLSSLSPPSSSGTPITPLQPSPPSLPSKCMHGKPKDTCDLCAEVTCGCHVIEHHPATNSQKSFMGWLCVVVCVCVCVCVYTYIYIYIYCCVCVCVYSTYINIYIFNVFAKVLYVVILYGTYILRTLKFENLCEDTPCSVWVWGYTVFCTYILRTLKFKNLREDTPCSG